MWNNPLFCQFLMRLSLSWPLLFESRVTLRIPTCWVPACARGALSLVSVGECRILRA